MGVIRKLIWSLLGAALVIFGLSFALLNPAQAALNLYVGTVTLPLAVWIVLSLVVGALLGVLATAHKVGQQRRELSRLRRSADDANRELTELRKLPVRNQP